MTEPSGDPPLRLVSGDGAGKAGDGGASAGGITPAIPGPLPGELGIVAGKVGSGGGAVVEGSTEIPLAGELVSPKEAAALRKASRAKVKVRIVKPELVDGPLWPMPEEVRGRAWLATMAMLVVVGLYGWMLSFYYAGAHGGVDQAGYLMTARLLTGEMNIDSPTTPAKPAPAAAAHVAAATAAASKPAPLVWAGGAGGYTEEHPAPAAIQLNTRWDWLRNRLSFVPESPFQFASRMCIMIEPFGPASADVPAATFGNAPHVEAEVAATRPGAEQSAATKPFITGKPAEYRYYAKYPFGFSLMAAVGREIDSYFDKQKVVTRVPATRGAMATRAGAAVAATQSSGGAGAEPATQVAATQAAARTTIVKSDAVGKGFAGMYIVNPVCTVLACFFAYFMYRQAVSPFVALIGVIWLACNPLVLAYSNDANSHASTLMCVSLGFWGLISFLRTKDLWRAWVGGLALGYACTIRYSEFLLVLPVVFAAAVHFRPNWQRIKGSLSLVAAWAIPVAVLGFVCWVSFGSATKTGYTYCNEDTGFGWKYLSGDWGDRQITGNWETLVTQMNRTGLFVMWPLALAGIFGMLASAWRLGGIIALWVIPSMVLYMLYYWAPGGDTTTGYLRFFVSVMPGLIFAGVWVLERALAGIKGEKWAGLAAGTLLGIGLLLVVAFYADGGPEVLDGGLGKMIAGFAHQAPGALWHLVNDSWLGFWCALIILLAVAGMWIFDGELVGARTGVALGAGAITALGCAINLYTIMPQMESAFVRWTTLRVIVDNMREVLPRGSVVFCEDNLLNQLDCVGGWKLYNSALFTPALYAQSNAQVDQHSKPEEVENPDPNPLQLARARFYMELLMQTSKVGNFSLGAKSAEEIRQMEKTIVDENIAQGHRVTFLTLTDAGDMGGGGIAGSGAGVAAGNVEGYQRVVLRKWTVSPEPSGPVNQGAAAIFAGNAGPGGRGGRGGRGGGRGGRGGRGAAGGPGVGAGAILPQTLAANMVAKQGATYVLYELVKKGGGGMTKDE